MSRTLVALCLSLAALTSHALDLSGVRNAHDPGTLTRDGDTYFNFTTGTGIWYSTSTDLVNWKAGPGPVFTSYPSWINTKVPGFTGAFWAPDVIHSNGYYYLYYSVSTFGSSNSAIGVARSRSLKSPAWTDLGIVVQSNGGGGEINAIDPAVFRDQDGKLYLSYGSFFGGIGVAELDPATGKLATGVTRVLGGNGLDMEAPYITRNGDFYYLFVNRGRCCQGSNSTYSVQVYRATSPFGPYSAGGTIMNNYDGTAPNHKGPGHVGVLKQDGCNYVSTHYYDTNDVGNAKLQLMKMTFDVNGWPVLTRNFTSITSCGGVSDGLHVLRSVLSGKAATVATASTVNGARVQQLTYSGAANQQWYVVGHGNGWYSLINAHSRLGLDNYGNSTTAGTDVAQWEYWGGQGQQWSFSSAGNGRYFLKNRLSVMALDVEARSTADNAQLIQYPDNGGTNQQWTLTRP